MLGETISDKLEILIDGRPVVSSAVSELKDSWAAALKRALQVETVEELVASVLERS